MGRIKAWILGAVKMAIKSEIPLTPFIKGEYFDDSYNLKSPLIKGDLEGFPKLNNYSAKK